MFPRSVPAQGPPIEASEPGSAEPETSDAAKIGPYRKPGVETSGYKGVRVMTARKGIPLGESADEHA